MFDNFPLFPESASTTSGQVDGLFLTLCVICGLASVVVWIVIVVFAIRYRRRPGHEVPIEYEPYLWLEWSWTIIPLIIFMGLFLVGARTYFHLYRTPDDALDVYVTGKQWMWKFQHIGGQSEINELHVPVGRPIRLTMASEDVIHSLFFPSFRIKTDVIPARYTVQWFESTKTGTYRLFCAEYCGSEHARMIGRVHVMSPAAYQSWLSGGTPEGAPADLGEELFQSLACNTCHTADASARGPVLTGLFGARISMADGRVVVADENYIRESILNPAAKVAAGFQPIMPTFQGQVNEQQLMQLLAYIKTLTPEKAIPPVNTAPPPTATPAAQENP
jgi:cytochrome c oxidase subunit 2